MTTWEYPEIGPDFTVVNCTDLDLLLWLSFQVHPCADLAFARFVELTESDLFGYFRKRVFGQGAAGPEDFCQDTYVKVFEQRRKCRPMMARQFLFIVGRSVLWSRNRKPLRGLDPNTVQSACEIGDEAEQDTQCVDVMLDLQAAMSRLSDHHSELIYLHIIEELGVTEIAERLAMTKQTASRRLRKAMDDLRGLMGDWG